MGALRAQILQCVGTGGWLSERCMHRCRPSNHISRWPRALLLAQPALAHGSSSGASSTARACCAAPAAAATLISPSVMGATTAGNSSNNRTVSAPVRPTLRLNQGQGPRHDAAAAAELFGDDSLAIQAGIDTLHRLGGGTLQVRAGCPEGSQGGTLAPCPDAHRRRCQSPPATVYPVPAHRSLPRAHSSGLGFSRCGTPSTFARTCTCAAPKGGRPC
jgi:hypothetical protein